ncbi:MAG: response regulator transcription factor [Bacteroidales bacterium]|jgi:DNA-binding NarL/FixJ family response regulator|nr:response regulator transcription factor [Bacteroidales bacterium]MCK9447729.1 response regulator transcription factor [Bacteroidales bacterium]MDD3700148.1 response regulator transcription factor [Bacteroidales bacterium]MDY0369028.1 response regulator transcription factor [Bacteroidales bacterium]
METKILVFEDNETLRNSIKVLLQGVNNYTIAGDFANCENVLQIVEKTIPDIIIMDIDMPVVNGIQGVQLIKEKYPDMVIIMYTVFEDDDRLFESLCAGANGYIIKNTSFVQLIDAIEDALTGGAPMSPGIARKVLHSFHKTNKYDLSPQEKKVLKYLVAGYSYKMIANEIFVSINTVRSHIKNIYSKLHVNCGREAVAIALKDKIV